MQCADAVAVERAVRSFAAAMIGLAAHELNNRLAVMRETVGLLEDLARAGKSAVSGTARAHASLDDQVGRALNIVRTLCGLGKAFETAEAGFDAGAATQDLIALTERWARQRSLRIEHRIAADLPRADGEPALFLCLLHRLLLGCATHLLPGGSIVVQVDRDGAGLRLRLSAAGERPDDVTASGLADEGIDRELAHRLGGELVLEAGSVPTLRLAGLSRRAPC